MGSKIYIRCPRCDLNYIEKSEGYCNVCKMEMKASSEFKEEISQELCPICHINYISANQKMCDSCREEVGDYDFEEEDEEQKEWLRYLGEDDGKEDEDEDELGENMSVIDMDDEDVNLGFKDDDDLLDLGIDDEEFEKIQKSEEFDDSEEKDDFEEDFDDDFEDDEDDEDFEDEEDFDEDEDED